MIHRPLINVWLSAQFVGGVPVEGGTCGGVVGGVYGGVVGGVFGTHSSFV